jgi:hypothetical protein
MKENINEENLSPLEKATKKEAETHAKSLKLLEESLKDPDNETLKREAGYASVEWTEALAELEDLKNTK